MSAQDEDDRALARQLLDADEAHQRERPVDPGLTLVRARRALEAAVPRAQPAGTTP